MRQPWMGAGVLAVALLAHTSVFAGEKAAKAEEVDHDLGPVQIGAITGQRLLDIAWQPGPFPGSRVATLAGDPKTGMHHTYLELPKGARIPPHWHSTDEWVTVVEGIVLFGPGETFDEKAARLFGPGAFLRIPAHTPHYAWAKERTILSQTRTGAVDFNWVHPEDDPTRVKAAPEAEKK